MKRVLMQRTLQRLIVTFTPEGIEYAVSYQHDASHSKSTSPGMKTRTVQAARMATAGLERALANLKDSEPKWGRIRYRPTDLNRQGAHRSKGEDGVTEIVEVMSAPDANGHLNDKFVGPGEL
jgi:hypothetical protein